MRQRVLCPRHVEDTPSCVVYEDEWYCFGCGASGTLEEIGYESLREVPETKIVENLEETFKYINSLPVMSIRGLSLPSDRSSYYVVWPGNTYYKRRFIGDTKSKYVSPVGHKKPLFRLHECNMREPLYLIEGEINALSLKDMFPLWEICSPGSATDMQNKRYVEDLMPYPEFVIIADADPAGAIGAIKLKSNILDRGYKPVKIVLVDEDINDLLVKYGKEEAKKRLLGMLQGL